MTDSRKKPKGSTRNITISITAETNAGGRPYMEDYLAVELEANEESQKLPHLREQAYIGVFDGHGGKEAAKYARDRLWDVIQKQPKFQLTEPEGIKEALGEAYVALHQEMEPLRATWKRHRTGELSTAGTTASTIVFRGDHIFVANVGDSTAVLAVNNPERDQTGQHPVKAMVLTKDHKPEDPNEINNIQILGGSVKTSKKGIPRVVWERERKEVQGGYVYIPFLGVSRSLGDFWSFNPRTKKFIVSPKPDVYSHRLDLKEQKFLVIASDGLWNVMSPDEVVQFIWDYQNASVDDEGAQPRDVVKAIINQALDRWARKFYPADNIAVLIAFLSESSAGSTAKTKQHRTIPRNGKCLVEGHGDTKAVGHAERRMANGLDSSEPVSIGEGRNANKMEGSGCGTVVDMNSLSNVEAVVEASNGVKLVENPSNGATTSEASGEIDTLAGSGGIGDAVVKTFNSSVSKSNETGTCEGDSAARGAEDIIDSSVSKSEETNGNGYWEGDSSNIDSSKTGIVDDCTSAVANCLESVEAETGAGSGERSLENDCRIASTESNEAESVEMGDTAVADGSNEKTEGTTSENNSNSNTAFSSSSAMAVEDSAVSEALQVTGNSISTVASAQYSPEHDLGKKISSPIVKDSPDSMPDLAGVSSNLDSMHTEEQERRPCRFRLGKRPITEDLYRNILPLKRFKSPSGAIDCLGKEVRTIRECAMMEDEDSGVHSDDAAGSEELPTTANSAEVATGGHPTGSESISIASLCRKGLC